VLASASRQAGARCAVRARFTETNGDTSSLVRWLTLFGHGYVELGRPEQAFDFYERALKIARAVPELQMPFMTLVGKADALVKVGRVSEAEELVTTTLAEAAKEGSLGYQAELTLRLAFIAVQRKQTPQALEAMSRAAEFARAAGGNGILAGIALERARILRAANRSSEAEAALREGITASRSMGERLLLPRLLAQLADLELSAGRRAQASELLQEADDLLEGLLTNASSPWVRGRIFRAWTVWSLREFDSKASTAAGIRHGCSRSWSERGHARSWTSYTHVLSATFGSRRICAKANAE
jgi:tetratricopeptide (TPR) repeat protein